MINSIDNRHYIEIPFDLKESFKKEFSTAKWDGNKKQWSVGSRSLDKLKKWANDHADKINAASLKKEEFTQKLDKMFKLTGHTYDLKDILKNKFNGIFHSYTEKNVTYSNWYVPTEFAKDAQEMVDKHNQEREEEKKIEKLTRKYAPNKYGQIDKNLKILIKLHNDAIDGNSLGMPQVFLDLGDMATKVTGHIIPIIKDYLRFSDENDRPEIRLFDESLESFDKIEKFLTFYKIKNNFSI
jgi:hypothetical protein